MTEASLGFKFSIYGQHPFDVLCSGFVEGRLVQLSNVSLYFNGNHVTGYPLGFFGTLLSWGCFLAYLRIDISLIFEKYDPDVQILQHISHRIFCKSYLFPDKQNSIIYIEIFRLLREVGGEISISRAFSTKHNSYHGLVMDSVEFEVPPSGKAFKEICLRHRKRDGRHAISFCC
ncbi:hypothetical protein BDZ91DRAFT_364942 [Kalaharituber pfeilii]|nr:hypothetical protein BDZ91DRAFT_364942 [Kalaharituber pfeilii]